MSFISYAQNFEDVMLWRALKHVPNGVYVDIGAQHPLIDSVSKAFYEAGWRGIHIEPVPAYAELLRKDRPDETVLQVALGVTEGTLELNIIDETGLSTAVEQYAELHENQRGLTHRRVQVPMLTMKSALHSLAGSDVHWLKIDVEGFEEQVLRGWDSNVLRPWIMVVEATIPNSPQTDYAGWDPILTGADYQFVYFDGLNRFYVAKEHDELIAAFSAPPNVFDEVQLFAAQQREQWLQNEWDAVVVREQWLQNEWDAAIAKAQHLQNESDAAIAKAQQLQTGWDAAIADAQQLQDERDAALGRVALAATAAHDDHERIAALQAALDDAQAAQLAARQAAVDLAQQLHAAQTSIAELNQWSHHWWTVASAREQECQSVYASKSWKITAPLRRAVAGAKLVAGRGRRSPQWLRRQVDRLLRPAVLWAMRKVLGQRRLAGFALGLLAKHPGLKARLRRVATRAAFDSHALPSTPNSETASIMTALNMPPRAARLYADLQIAAAKKDH